MACALYTMFQKSMLFDSNFGKCGSILKNFLAGDLQENFLCTHHRDFRLTCNMLLHYLVKVGNPKMILTLTAPRQTVDMFLRTL